MKKIIGTFICICLFFAFSLIITFNDLDSYKILDAIDKIIVVGIIPTLITLMITWILDYRNEIAYIKLWYSVQENRNLIENNFVCFEPGSKVKVKKLYKSLLEAENDLKLRKGLNLSLSKQKFDDRLLQEVHYTRNCKERMFEDNINTICLSRMVLNHKRLLIKLIEENRFSIKVTPINNQRV